MNKFEESKKESRDWGDEVGGFPEQEIRMAGVKKKRMEAGEISFFQKKIIK